MTRDEFRTLVRRFCQYFPNFSAWLSRLPEPDATLAAWFPAFEPEPLADLEAVLPLMVANADGYEPLASVDFESFPRKLPRYARKLRYDTSEAKQPEPEPYAGAWSHVTSEDAVMASELDRLLEAHESVRTELLVDGRPQLGPVALNREALERIGGVDLERQPEPERLARIRKRRKAAAGPIPGRMHIPDLQEWDARSRQFATTFPELDSNERTGV